MSAIAVQDTGTHPAGESREGLRAVLHHQAVGKGTGLGLSQNFRLRRQSGGGRHHRSELGPARRSRSICRLAAGRDQAAGRDGAAGPRIDEPLHTPTGRRPRRRGRSPRRRPPSRRSRARYVAIPCPGGGWRSRRWSATNNRTRLTDVMMPRDDRARADREMARSTPYRRPVRHRLVGERATPTTYRLRHLAQASPSPPVGRGRRRPRPPGQRIAPRSEVAQQSDRGEQRPATLPRPDRARARRMRLIFQAR